MSALACAAGAAYRVDGRDLVRDASLALEAGEIAVVVGPNGAGKSTLLKLLCGELRPTRGRVESLGASLDALPPWRLACRRAVMTQSSRIAFPFRVHEVARLGLEGIATRLSGRAVDDIVAGALARADVLALSDRNFQTLSGGEQQRVQFARTLCQLEAGRGYEPSQILFLDEPIASLDLCHQLDLLNAVRDLARSGGVAVLAVLHDLNLSLCFADRLVVMDKGRIVRQGRPSETLDRAVLRSVFGVDIGAAATAFPGAPVMVLPQFCTVARDRRDAASGEGDEMIVPGDSVASRGDPVASRGVRAGDLAQP